MVVLEAQRWNFCYVLPDKPGNPVQLVVPSALQMGWCESPPFFCSASETARDVADEMRHQPLGSHPRHPLEEWMLPPDQWPEDTLADTCEKFLEMIEVYVDDFIGIAQTRNVDWLRHLSRSLLHAIHQVFPPPAVTGHSGGDSVSEKKLEKGEGAWDICKEILGWVFDGARRCIELPREKAEKISSYSKLYAASNECQESGSKNSWGSCDMQQSASPAAGDCSPRSITHCRDRHTGYSWVGLAKSTGRSRIGGSYFAQWPPAPHT